MAIASFFDVKDRVMSYVQKTSQIVSEEVLEDLMEMAEWRIWGVLRVPEMRSVYSWTYAAGGEDITNFDSGNIIEPIACLVDISSDTREEIPPGSESVLRRWMIKDDTDAPRVFGYISESDGTVKVAIGPEPTGKTVYFPYFRKFPSLTSATNVVFNKYPHIWLFALLTEAALFIEDMEKFSIYEQKFTDFVSLANQVGRGLSDAHKGGVPGPQSRGKWRP